ncbi:lantibiotic dehydratase [Streptomyces kronopolitis]|uniref:lantibiotic dehydratase n=1 Tax=Streptomyces kronopolitis TaxID=1612435 RepID=UPI0036989DF0
MTQRLHPVQSRPVTSEPDQTFGYEAAGSFLLRAPALPFEVFQDLTEAPSAERARLKLRRLAGNAQFRRALEVAGSGLLGGLDRIDRDPAATQSRTRRVYAAMLRYVTRMSTRATPHGTFAGVALGRFGQTTTLRLGSSALGRERARADMGWLMAWVKQFERDEANLPLLGLRANDLAYAAGGRLILPLTDVHGEGDRRSVSVRATPPVQHIMGMRPGTLYPELVRSVCKAYPEAGRERVETLVRQLHELNMITSDLRPPLDEPHPERWLLARLESIDEPGPSGPIADLRRVRVLLQLAECGDVMPVRQAQEQLVPQYERQTYQLDSALDVRTPQLAQTVATEVAEAAACLARLAATRTQGSLKPYHTAFLTRYGENTLVPVLEVLSPEQGLDAPPDYQNPPRSTPFDQPQIPVAQGPAVNPILGELVGEALRAPGSEVELTDTLLDRLTPQESTAASLRAPAARLDVHVHLQADSAFAIDRGEWRAVLTELAAGGGTFGRFSDVLDSHAQALLKKQATSMEEQSAATVYADLSYLPLAGFAGNVGISPRLHTYEIPVNTTPSVSEDFVITLDDILVGATPQQLYLWSRRLNRQVIVKQNSRLNPYFAPNVCRFLLEVSLQERVTNHAFSWGSWEGAPFLPRVRRGRVVVHRARWRLTSQTLTKDPGRITTEEFAAAVRTWRHTWNVPRLVEVIKDSGSLLLDLEQHLCLEELQASLRKCPESLVLCEPAASPDTSWLLDKQGRGYAAEIVIPMSARPTHTVSCPPPVPRCLLPARGALTTRRRYLPGSRWSHLKLYAGPDQHNAIIAGPLRKLISKCEEHQLIDRWFYIRYADPRPHLRVRLRAQKPYDGHNVLRSLLDWGRELVAEGIADDFALATYEPETGRYGGNVVFDNIERVFHANSAVSADLLAQDHPGGKETEPECLAVAVLAAMYSQWGLSHDRQLDLVPLPIVDEAEQQRVRALFRQRRDELRRLLSITVPHGPTIGSAPPDLLAAALETQQPALAQAGESVRTAAAAQSLWGTEKGVLASLAHIQLNRLMPIDYVRENRCYLLWRHTLRELRGRAHAAPQ